VKTEFENKAFVETARVQAVMVKEEEQEFTAIVGEETAVGFRGPYGTRLEELEV